MAAVIAFCFLLSFLIGSLDAHVAKRSDDVTVTSLQVLIQQQGAVIQQQGATIQQQGAAIQDLQSRLTASETKGAATVADLTSLQSKFAQKVAFTAHFTSPHVANIGEHAILKFDNVITNIAQGYHPQTGIFSAPVAGLYMFFVQLMGENDAAHIEVILDKHGSELLRVWTSRADDQGSVMTTTHMNAGEEVWVRHYGGSTAIQGYWSYFSGALLQAD